MLCNANPRNKNKKIKNKKQKKIKNQRTMVTKGKAMKHKDPCQKDSIRSSLLHPKPFRCTSSIGVLIYVRMITNFRIGIKV